MYIYVVDLELHNANIIDGCQQGNENYYLHDEWAAQIVL